ncbi:MAG: hypothetical protein ABGZ17_11450 [Planctomycetaceae bacterium]
MDRTLELSMWVFAGAIPFAGFSPSRDSAPPPVLRLPGTEGANLGTWSPAEAWPGDRHDRDHAEWIPSAEHRSGRWSVTTRYRLLIVRPDPNVHFKILIGPQKSSAAFSMRVIEPYRDRHRSDFIQVYRPQSGKPGFSTR